MKPDIPEPQSRYLSAGEIFFGKRVQPHHFVFYFLLLSLVFGLAYAQAPLYTSNQNQYFLRGAALAGVGDLDEDWLVTTGDSTPVFSFMVRVVFQFLDPAAFYLMYALLLGLYLASLAGIFRTLHTSMTPRHTLLLLGLLMGLHSAALRFLLSRIPGEHWEYLLEAGFAGQRLLGPVLQPSTFGVLLLASIFLYLRRKPAAAALLAVLAATIHPTYLLSAASLTLAFIIGELLETRSLKKPLLIGVTALAAVLPVLIYVLRSFSPSSAEITRQAQEILVSFRIPQHTQIGLWLDVTVAVKLLLITSGLWFARRTRLFPVLLVPAAIMLLLTGVQVLLDSSSLALLFPWRLSTWLVPLSTAVTAGTVLLWLLQKWGAFLEKNWISTAVFGIAAVLALIGGVKFIIEVQRKDADPANSMMVYVRGHSSGDQIYMIPPKLQVFRLETGEPVLVDFKSIPYHDREVLDWYDRIRLAQYFYRDSVEYISCDLLDKAASKYGVTHVVLGEAQLGVDCAVLRELYRDEAYGVYSLSVETSP